MRLHHFIHAIRAKAAVYFALALMSFSVLMPTVANALDVNFFSNNDILFYNPEDCAVSAVNTNGQTVVAIVGNDNAEKIFNFLTGTSFSGLNGQPFNAVQAAGALGNFMQESSMDPAAVEQPSGAGHGLAQWSFGRWATLQSLAAQQGKQWSDLSVQLQMIENEINGSYGKSLLAAGFGNVTDPGAASEIFTAIYEGPDTAQANQTKRDSAAQAYYTAYKDKTPTTAAAASTSQGGGTTGGCATAGQPSGNFADNSQFTFYNQCDSPWGPTVLSNGGTFCNNGCGPTSMAMAIKNMTGQGVTPTETMNFVSDRKWWNANPGGTSFDTNMQTAANWGLKGTVLSAAQAQNLDYIRSVLAGGGLVMVAGYGAAPYYGQTAHFILIRAITADGHILIANPAPIDKSTTTGDNVKQWNSGDIINGNTFGGIAITK